MNPATTTQQISACRLELPRFCFVDVDNLRARKRQQILSSFTTGDLASGATEQSIARALDNLTK